MCSSGMIGNLPDCSFFGKAGAWRSRTVAGQHALGVALVGVMLASCATADRAGAGRLAGTGVAVSTALVEEIDDRRRRLLDAAADDSFNYAYTVMSKCRDAAGRPAVTRAGAVSGVNPDCDVLATAEARRNSAVIRQAARLDGVMRLRAEAAIALSVAYRAFAAEAAYDAEGDMEDAVIRAAASVSAFGQAVGVTPLAPVVGKAAQQIGGALADKAQRRRLLVASDRLRMISNQLRRSLERERDLHIALDKITADLGAETIRNLVRAEALDPVPALRGVAEHAGVAVGGEAGAKAALARDPALEAAAVVTTLVRRPSQPPDALAAAISALAALDLQHAAYAEKKPVSAEDAAAALARLAAVARTTG